MVIRDKQTFKTKQKKQTSFWIKKETEKITIFHSLHRWIRHHEYVSYGHNMIARHFFYPLLVFICAVVFNGSFVIEWQLFGFLLNIKYFIKMFYEHGARTYIIYVVFCPHRNTMDRLFRRRNFILEFQKNPKQKRLIMMLCGVFFFFYSSESRIASIHRF